jgi:Sap, sulfolipid-1-addressing protein
LLVQAAGFALLAALSPTALLVAAVYLGSANPRRTALLYLAGALVMSGSMAVVVLLVLRAGHFELPSHHQTRYGLRLALGLLILVIGLVVERRKPKPPDPDNPKRGFVSRLVASPAPLAAFASGIVIFSPSVTFIAAVQVIATARTSAAVDVFALALIVVIDVMFVWLPFVGYLVRPEATSRRLKSFNAWLRAKGHLLLAGGMIVAGLLLTLDGALGLTGVV